MEVSQGGLVYQNSKDFLKDLSSEDLLSLIFSQKYSEFPQEIFIIMIFLRYV